MKVLDVVGGLKRSGVNVQLYEYNGTDAQLWRFYKNGSYYFIKNKLGYCLDVYGGSAYSGANIWVYTENGTNAQKFKLDEIERAKETKKYYVTTRVGLNLRDKPSNYGSIILTMPYRSEVEVSNISNGWATCIYNGNKSYCSSVYIKLASSYSQPTPSSNSGLPSGVYFEQEWQSTCTLSSAAMMLRTRAYQIGKNWQKITESSIKEEGWINGEGLKWSFAYDEMSVSHVSYSGISLSELISLLNKNPAGIVLYCGKLPHAVWVISVSGDTVYCADPLKGYSGKKISLVESYLGYKYNYQDNILDHVTAIWYVERGMNMATIMLWLIL